MSDYRWLLLLGVCGLSACATLPPPREGAAVVRCEEAYAAADAAIERAGATDAQGARVPGFPHLRTDRFLASLAADPLTDPQREQLLDLMVRAGARARAVELDQLPPDSYRALDAAYPPGIGQTLQACSKTLRAADATRADLSQRLARAASMPDDYATWKRVVGLYPLVALPLSLGARSYESETQAVFAAPIESLSPQGSLTRYAARSRADRLSTRAVATIVAQSRRNPLGLPMPRPPDALALVATFAPDVLVDEVDEHDRIGAPAFGSGDELSIRPPAVAYVRFAFTRVGERVLLQIVYTFWFAARPKTSAFDLLGGALDGVVWRVTIADDGGPLLFDSIHPCGCYHQFFPTPRVSLRDLPATLEETALVPQRLPRLEANDRIALRVESRTHFLQRILVNPSSPRPARRYFFVPDDALRRLPGKDGTTRSLFGPDGIVPGTERAEQYLLWPSGIRAPGAMRQWSRHATAFVGRRHFDEPRLIERYFILQ